MMKIRPILATALVVTGVAALSLSAANAGGDYKKSAQAAAATTAPLNLLETAKAGGFTTLAAAVKAAGLEEALSGKEPLTVFAPTDEAFKKLPEGALEGLLNDKEALKNVLLYHVLPGTVKSGDVVKLKSAKALNGQELKVDATKGVKINDATVTKADVEASNGVIHVIDTVLLPPAKK
jgi:uncharacterized surface protein with fasciclin (FAS1) repeats